MQEFMIAAVLTFVGGYLLGSVNFAIIISRLIAKEDIRRFGSNNAGSTNMLRTYGKGPAALTFLLDFLKGVLAVGIAGYAFAYFAPNVGEVLAVTAPYIGGAGALLGHIFPVYFGFRGGKGVATGLGILCGCSFIAFLVVAVIFVPIVPVSGYVSLASISGASSFPIALGIVRYFQGQFSFIEVISAIPLAVLLVFTHRENIKRLLQGTERKISFKK